MTLEGKVWHCCRISSQRDPIFICIKEMGEEREQEMRRGYKPSKSIPSDILSLANPLPPKDSIASPNKATN